MKFAKWFVVVAGCTLVFSTVVMAQQGPGAASRAARMESRQEDVAAKITAVLDKLNLTADQKTQVDKILADHKAALEAFRAQNGQQMRELLQQVRQATNETDRAAARAKLEPLMKQRAELGKKTVDAVMAVLTPDQQATLKEQLAEAFPRAAGILELAHIHHAIRAANLTDDQKPKVKAIMEQAATDAKAAADPKAKQEILQKAVKEIEAVLTPDQLAKFKEALKEPLAPGAASQPAAK